MTDPDMSTDLDELLFRLDAQHRSAQRRYGASIITLAGRAAFAIRASLERIRKLRDALAVSSTASENALRMQLEAMKIDPLHTNLMAQSMTRLRRIHELEAELERTRAALRLRDTIVNSIDEDQGEPE